MKKLVSNIKYEFFPSVIMMLLAFNCGDTDANLDNSTKVTSRKTINDSSIKVATEEKLVLVENLFDSIAFTTIDWILTDRVKYETPNVKPNLKELRLGSYKDVINNSKVIMFIDSMIAHRDRTILEAEKTEIKLKPAVNEFLKSDLYKKKILKTNSDSLKLNDISEEVYLKNLKKVDTKVNKLIEKVIIEFDKKEKSIAKLKKKKEDLKDEHGGIMAFFKDKVWWLLGVLIISILLNIYQYITGRKKSKTKENSISNKQAEPERENNYLKASAVITPPSKLRPSKVEDIITAEYDNLMQLFQRNYHRDCTDSISGKMNSLKEDVLEVANSKSFNAKEDVLEFIEPKRKTHHATLIDELKNCIAKDNLQPHLMNVIGVQDFIRKVNTEIISEDEIQTKIKQHVETFISEFNRTTIGKTQLDAEIVKLKEDIWGTLQKMVQDGLIYYFPFADTDGILKDDKKTKEIGRDSAIHLVINPDDLSTATFTLLYEQNEMMRAGIMSYDSFLIPICELKGEDFNSVGTKIEQIGPDGTMELEDGHWKVKNKLPIKVV